MSDKEEILEVLAICLKDKLRSREKNSLVIQYHGSSYEISVSRCQWNPPVCPLSNKEYITGGR